MEIKDRGYVIELTKRELDRLIEVINHYVNSNDHAMMDCDIYEIHNKLNKNDFK